MSPGTVCSTKFLRHLRYISACFFALISTVSHAALTSPDGLWATAEVQVKTASNPLGLVSDDARQLTTSDQALRQALTNAPLANSGKSGLTLFLPLPMGNNPAFLKVSVWESPIMHEALAAKFPEIKTYAFTGIDDPTIHGRLDITPAGFHGMAFTKNGIVYINPLNNQPQQSSGAKAYESVSRASRQKNSTKPAFTCQNPDHQHSHGGVNDFAYLATAKLSSAYQGRSAGGDSRTYRLAVAATGEYTNTAADGTQSGGLAAVVTAINRVSGIFEKEAGILFELVADNEDIIYTNSSTDPYTNSDIIALLSQNQTNVDSVIGSANYDIGHIFATTNGGIASLASVCSDGYKAQGVTGLPTLSDLTSDVFYVDYVAHEMGHQFGAEHTFNAVSASNCTTSTIANPGSFFFSTPSSFEVGSGSTIMGYANICSPQNIQSYSDDYFHARSLEQIRMVADGDLASLSVPACGTVNTLSPANNPPTVSAGSDYTIPANTPFRLTGSASDADAADSGTITYGWEQYDIGSTSSSLTEMHTDDGSRTLFRSYPPTSSATRYFPNLSTILSGDLTATTGERLPTTSRDMTFRLTARSGNTTGRYGFNQDDMTVTVSNVGDPFAVTQPTNASTWNVNEDLTVEWDVGCTDVSPVNCSTVDILLSTDSGSSFTTTLATATANDGSETLSSPPAINTSTARLQVACSNNVFFAVNPGGDFTINGIGSPKGLNNNQSISKTISVSHNKNRVLSNRDSCDSASSSPGISSGSSGSEYTDIFDVFGSFTWWLSLCILMAICYRLIAKQRI